MRKNNNLVLMGQKLSNEYIQDGIDLTKNLEKTAIDMSLNKQQAKRVAEAANVETFLRLAPVAKDGYVEFPLANVEQAYKNLEVDSKKEAAVAGDQWADVPSRALAEALENFDSLKKEASVEDLSFYKVAEDLLEIQKNDASVYHSYHSLVDAYQNAENYIKQAMAYGYDISDLKTIIKEAAPIHGDYLFNSLKDNISKEHPTQDFTKEASTEKLVDQDTQVFRSIALYEKTASSLLDNTYSAFNRKLEFCDLVKETRYKHYTKEATQNLEFLKNFISKDDNDIITISLPSEKLEEQNNE